MNRTSKITLWFVAATGLLVISLSAQVTVRKDVVKKPLQLFSIDNIQFLPNSPASLRLGSQVKVKFDYSSPQEVRIFVRPMTKGALTPNYAASGAGLSPAGKGVGEGNFTIKKRAAFVDQVRFQMYNNDQSKLLFEKLVKVRFSFSLQVRNAYNKKPYFNKFIWLTGIVQEEQSYWYVGSKDPHTILWQTLGYTYPTMKQVTLTCTMQYIGDDVMGTPCNAVYVIGTDVPNTGSYTFVLPDSIPYMGEFRIQIIGYGGLVSNTYNTGIY